MASELDRLQQIAEKQSREKAKIEGRIETLMEELSDEGFDNIKSAKSALKTMEKALKREKAEFKRKMEKFKADYPNEFKQIA